MPDCGEGERTTAQALLAITATSLSRTKARHHTHALDAVFRLAIIRNGSAPDICAAWPEVGKSATIAQLVNKQNIIAMIRKRDVTRSEEHTQVQRNTRLSMDTPLTDYVGYALRRAQLLVFQHLVDELAEFDLRPAQFTALAVIDSNPGLTQADLARALAVEPPQLVPLLNKLETLALAVRVRCKPDKRSYGLFLSKAGETLLKQLKEVAMQSDLAATSRLSESEREQLLALLQKIHGAD